MKDFDLQAYSFIERLSEYKPQARKMPKFITKNEEPILDLGEVTDLKISELNEFTLEKKSSFHDVNGKHIGLANADYTAFYDFVAQLLDEPFFNRYSDVEFLTTHAFKWLIDVYKSGKATNNLKNYLIDLIKAESKEFTFYSRIEYLAIESTLRIGNVTITKFNEEQIEDFYLQSMNTMQYQSVEDFKIKHSSIFNALIAITKAEGVHDRASIIALKEIELAIDVLKCFCIPFSLRKDIQMLDIDYRIRQSRPSQFFSIHGNDFKNSRFTFKNRTSKYQSVYLTDDYLKASNLGLFSDYISHISQKFITNNADELCYAIVELIQHLADIVGTADDYQKVIKAVTSLESFLFGKEKNSKAGENKIKKLSKIVLRNKNDQDRMARCTRSMYTVRDRYLHNYQLCEIKYDFLNDFLAFQLELIAQLIVLNKNVSRLEDTYKHFNIEN